MNGPHDLGGSHGFGPVPVEDGAAFHADWERRTFAIVMAMSYAHRIPRTLDESRFAIESLPPGRYLNMAYFERWLLAGEGLYEAYGALTAAELAAKRRKLASDPDAPRPDGAGTEQIEQVIGLLRGRRRTRKVVDSQPKYTPGDAVMAQNIHTKSHTRMPRYVRGRHGSVDRVRGAFDVPERAAAGAQEAEFVYEVRFEGGELWGESAEPRTCVYIQLWESYLQPA